MTDNEIIKALECCGTERLKKQLTDEMPCNVCPMRNCEDCEVELPDCALDLINRQKAEIDNGVMVSFMPVKKQNYRIEIAKVEVLDDGEMPVGFVHSLMINKLIEELRENVAKKVIISYEEGVYRAELPVIVPNEKEPF